MNSLQASDWLKSASKKLENAGIGTARLDCLVLLEDISGQDRAWLLAHPEYVLGDNKIAILNKLVARRTKNEPLAYIRGKTDFYGREFVINKDVLEPRPESETMIELLKQLVNGRPLAVGDKLQFADIGTGSGALAITVKLENTDAAVLAIDIDKKCLEVARQNAEKHKADITIIKGNLLEPLSTSRYPLTVILANLPYVPDNYQINEAALMEPRTAIFGGPDGLDLYREMFQQIADYTFAKKLHKPQLILTESLPFQHTELKIIAKKAGYRQINEQDFIQAFTPNT